LKKRGRLKGDCKLGQKMKVILNLIKIKKMNNLQKSPQQQELQIRESSLNLSIAVAIERTKTEPFIIQPMVQDILSEFPRISNDDFTLAIRNGSLGKYGKTYKLSTQEVCFWIREYLKEKNKKTLVI
jgi:hypothetical protein